MARDSPPIAGKPPGGTGARAKNSRSPPPPLAATGHVRADKIAKAVRTWVRANTCDVPASVRRVNDLRNRPGEEESRVLAAMASGKNQLQQHSPPSSVVASGGGGGKERQRLCTNCKNHGLFKVWKKHKRYCKYRDCQCAKCLKTAATRKNCAEQTAKRRARQEDELREQELQRNPMNFENERPIPYGNIGATGGSFRSGHTTNNRHVPALVPALFPGSSSVTKISSSRTSEYDDSSSIDIDGSGVSEMKVDRRHDVDIDAGKQ